MRCPAFLCFRQWGMRRRLLAGLAVLLLASAGGAAWWWFSQPEVIVVRKKKTPRITLDQAAQLYEAGRYEESLDFCNKNRKFYKDDPAFWNFCGVAMKTIAHMESNMAGRDEELAAFARALELDPHFAAARMNYANSLWETGQRDEAAAQYRRVLREDPDHPDFHAILERIDAHERRRAMAERQPPPARQNLSVPSAAPAPRENAAQPQPHGMQPENQPQTDSPPTR